MAERDLLITAGCSFSQVPNVAAAWPVHLQNELNYKDVIHLGIGSVGNGIISRRVIYNVSNQLKKGIKPENMLVGIMWSGPNRLEVMNTGTIPHREILPNNYDTYGNPCKIASDQRLWYILNGHWEDESTTTMFKNFYDEVYAAILTCEHILRTQWFLKANNIKYFMTTYAPKTLDKKYTRHKECRHLHDMIDFDDFLPIVDAFSAMESGPFKLPDNHDGHPTTDMHKYFTHHYILPFLKNKKYI